MNLGNISGPHIGIGITRPIFRNSRRNWRVWDALYRHRYDGLPGYHYLPERHLEAESSTSALAPERPDMHRISPPDNTHNDEPLAA